MIRKKKIFLVLVCVVFFCVGVVSGCSKESKEEAAFKEFETKLSKGDYEGLYQLLSKDARGYISKEDFVSRYTNIYSGIGASNISVKKGELDDKNDTISFSLKMDTAAGEVEIKDYQLQLVKEEKEYKIDWDESLIFPQMKQGDKVRISTEKSTRGSILDRNNQPLAQDGTISRVGIHPVEFDKSNRTEKITELANTLDISEETITKELDANTNPDYFVPIVDILPNDEKLDTLQGRAADGILIKSKISRVYANDEAFGRLVGYIRPITAEELKKNEGKGYTQASLIGKSGLEQVYEDTLRGKDGAEIYIERDGEKIETIVQQAAQNGQDIKISIDSNLQTSIYKEMNGEKGAATAVDPKTGEILALVSSPSYNSNRYITYVTKTEQAKRESSNNADEENRFSKLYSPGSTFKLITATTGLADGKIDPNEAKSIPERTWQKDSSWGNYSITRVNSQPNINLKDAVKYSDNIYFAMSALDIGSGDFIAGAKNFGIGEEFNMGYPFAKSQISNDENLSSDVLLADSGYGQGEIMVTPLNMALAYSALSNNGNIMSPTLLLGADTEAKIWKEAAIPSAQLSTLQNAFSAVINEDGGTAHDARIADVRLVGKTGTAEIKASKEDKDGSENGWFVATDLDSAKISIAVVLEDVKEKGGSHAAIPVVKNVLSSYLK